MRFQSPEVSAGRTHSLFRQLLPAKMAFKNIKITKQTHFY